MDETTGPAGSVVGKPTATKGLTLGPLGWPASAFPFRTRGVALPHDNVKRRSHLPGLRQKRLRLQLFSSRQLPRQIEGGASLHGRAPWRLHPLTTGA